MRLHRPEVVLFLLLWGSFACFHHIHAGWNVNSRVALTYAIVERGTARIDGYDTRLEMETDDVAVFGGHVYSDKIIGTSLLGVPAFAAVKAVEMMRGCEFAPGARRYLVTVFSVGLLAALAGVMFFRLLGLYEARQRGGAQSGVMAGSVRDEKASRACAERSTGPFVITLLVFLGTQLFFYATLFMSYLPALFFGLWALLRFERWRDDDSAHGPPLLSCGLLIGLSLLCEYLMGIFAVFFALYVLALIPRKAAIWKFAAGAAVGILPFVVYTIAIFGRLAIPYEYERNMLFKEQMERGFLGASWPRLAVLELITLHPYRGLFIHSPFLLMSIAGLWICMRTAGARALALFVIGTTAGCLLFNSAYYMWWGGWSFGPRHLVPAIPFLAIPLIAVWHSRSARAVIVALGAVSVLLHLVVNSIDPQFRDLNPATPLSILLEPDSAHEYPWVFTLYIWPLFRLGYLGSNAGQLLGLRGIASLAPLLVFWAIMIWLGIRLLSAAPSGKDQL
ncbi:MAG: hypothetical protein NTY46_01965 [Candidatus Sumerlaeota bacterium]|nr:hypothetical protein [Candidatus Sumerlaeota bacterium]